MRSYGQRDTDCLRRPLRTESEVRISAGEQSESTPAPAIAAATASTSRRVMEVMRVAASGRPEARDKAPGGSSNPPGSINCWVATSRIPSKLELREILIAGFDTLERRWLRIVVLHDEVPDACFLSLGEYAREIDSAAADVYHSLCR